MDSFLWLVPVLGCGVGMILCMFVMGRMGRGKGHDSAPDPEVAALREEVASLRAARERERETLDG